VAGRSDNHGEYRLNLKPVVFNGRDRIDAKRRAMDYWYRQPRQSGLTLRQFLTCCRLTSDREITYYPQQRGL
jgi:hypothetical protein